MSLVARFELLETAAGPRTTVRSPYEWSDDTTWKDKVLTKEKWLERKAAYKDLKAMGQA